MVELTKQDKCSGLLVKHKPSYIRWRDAGLREASLDIEGYYLKVDGTSEDRNLEQLYLYLSSSDVAVVIASWLKAILEKGSEWAKFNLKEELQSRGLKLGKKA